MLIEYSHHLCQYIDMECPFCGSSQLSVVNSRPTKSNSQIWRRRQCIKCNAVFSTYERINLSYLIVQKKSGTHQKYSRAKLYAGIYHSMLDKKNADRGTLSVLSENITNEIEQKILKLRKKVITTNEVKKIVCIVLSYKSPDSLLRYIAYRESNNPNLINKKIKKYLLNN